MSTTDNKIWVIVPAAGSGQRMGVETPKQYLEINGKTILEITLSLLLKNKHIYQVVVCTFVDDQKWQSLAISDHNKISRTDGGESRANSVLNGLTSIENIAKDEDWVLVHDAARPCLSQDLLNNLVNKLSGDQVGGILAIPAKDTLKVSDSSGITIDKTLDRSQIWHAQTPQMFRYGLLKKAMDIALSSSFEITDEASAMEYAGHQVKIIEGDSTNLKITTQDDLKFAQFLLN